MLLIPRHITGAAAILIMSNFLCAARAQDQSDIIRGTINIVLANSHGMVVETDSMQTLTDQNGQRIGSREGQKLIRLDDRSVCAIAGFGSGAIPTAPQFGADIMGILTEYRDQLAGQTQAPTFAIKLLTISSLVEFNLSALANVRAVLYPAPSSASTYAFSLFLVGYDSDNSPKVGVLEIQGTPQIQPDGGYSWSFKERMDVTPIEQRLIVNLGGMWDAAQEALSHPENYSSNQEMQKYVRSRQVDDGASLQLEDTKALADFLADESSRRHPLEIGGQKQLCIFRDGKIETLQIPSFPEPPKPFRFNLVQNSRMNGHAIEAPLSVRFLFVRCTLVNDPRVRLDNNFFVGSEIRDSVVQYDGGDTLLDKTDKVINSQLILGPHADLKSNAAQSLIHRFPWINQSDLQ